MPGTEFSLPESRRLQSRALRQHRNCTAFGADEFSLLKKLSALCPLAHIPLSKLEQGQPQTKAGLTMVVVEQRFAIAGE